MTESSLLNDEYATLIEIDFDEDYNIEWGVYC